MADGEHGALWAVMWSSYSVFFPMSQCPAEHIPSIWTDVAPAAPPRRSGIPRYGMERRMGRLPVSCSYIVGSWLLVEGRLIVAITPSLQTWLTHRGRYGVRSEEGGPISQLHGDKSPVGTLYGYNLNIVKP